MAKEAEQALIDWHPLIAKIMEERRLFGVSPRVVSRGARADAPRRGLFGVLMRFLRRDVFDRFGRR